MEAIRQSQTLPPPPLLKSNRTPRVWWRVPSQAAAFAAALLAGLALRLWFLRHFFEVNGDALIYGGLAKNLLLHGEYALNGAGTEIYPTLIRLPGYPFFLAGCFRIFGLENYASAAWVQIALELLGCVLLAGAARRLCGPRAAMITLWLAALCPFTAIYAAQPLTEATTLFSIALALWAAAAFRESTGWKPALLFTFAATWAALLRPDGVLLGLALAPALLPALRRAARTRMQKMRMAAVCLLLAVLPFALWTERNGRVLHVFEPFAPRYANDPGEDTHPGFQRWMKTWCVDFNSTYDIYWNVPGGPLDFAKLPPRAFDSEAQRAATAALVAEYNSGSMELNAAQDARFAQLAEQRIDAQPLRYYVWLPLRRVADMSFRPRIENLPVDLDWWKYARHHAETRFSFAYLCLNALYVLLALGGLLARPRLAGGMLLYFALRCTLLSTMEGPEARYTLEFFPFFFVLGGIALARASFRLKNNAPDPQYS